MPSAADAAVIARLPRAIEIREVGPRDGLQSEPPLPASQRSLLVDALLAAGIGCVEACAFVSPKAVPSMAGAAEVLSGLRSVGDGVRLSALVPNLRGAEAALGVGVGELTVTVSASEAYSQKNVHKSTAESVREVAAIAALAAASSTPVDVVISCAFGSPDEGEIAPALVASVAREVLARGAARCTYADTTGMATPRRIADLLACVPDGDIGLHLHDTRGTALLNAYAAMQMGVTRFDCAVGGLGGSPFARGAAGNLATEELVYLCFEEGISTGIDLAKLLEAAALVRQMVGQDLPSRLAKAGPRLAAPSPDAAE